MADETLPEPVTLEWIGLRLIALQGAMGAIREDIRMIREDIRVIRLQIRVIEVRMDRTDDSLLRLLQDEHDREKRLRALERSEDKL